MMKRSMAAAVAAIMAAGQAMSFGNVVRHMAGGSEASPRASTGSSGGSSFVHDRKRSGWSCAEGKRRKARQRNKLRSKGQFRKAVR